MKDLNSSSEALFEQFLQENGNSRVIAANGKIMELIQKIVALEQGPTWYNAWEIDDLRDYPPSTEVLIKTDVTTRLGVLGDIELVGSEYQMRGANEVALSFMIVGSH